MGDPTKDHFKKSQGLGKRDLKKEHECKLLSLNRRGNGGTDGIRGTVHGRNRTKLSVLKYHV